MRQEKAKDKRKMRAHTKRTARRPGAKAEAARRPGTNPQNAGAPAGSPAHSRRAAAQSRHKSSRRRAGRKQSAETAVLPTPGAAGQTAASNFPHTLRLQKNSRGSRMDEKAGLKGYNSGRRRKNGQPGTWRDTPGAEKIPSEQAKLAFALLPARRGLVKRGRQKFASLFLAGTAFLLRVSDFTARCARFAARSAAQKGAPPPFIPRKLFEKSLSKNFHEGPGAPRP